MARRGRTRLTDWSCEPVSPAIRELRQIFRPEVVRDSRNKSRSGIKPGRHHQHDLTGGNISKKPEKAKPVYQSCNIKFPERVWELTENGWTSRPATAHDWESRRKLAVELNAVMLA